MWTEEECRNFEQGLKAYGKDFHLIQANKVSNDLFKVFVILQSFDLQLIRISILRLPDIFVR